MKQQYIIIALIAIVLFLCIVGYKRSKSRQRLTKQSKKPCESSLPKEPIHNDKLVIIEEVGEKEIKQIIQNFCNTYNIEQYHVLPRLVPLADQKFAITFPYDIQFELYCFFIHYINYPIGFDRYFKTVGWTTSLTTELGLPAHSTTLQLMLYISDVDTDYDNVCITTSDDIGYKLGFAYMEHKQLLDKPEKRYCCKPLQTSEIENKPYIDFK